jgi:Thermophilic glucose-6-phosphate isomerase and related metalloenzymes
MVPFGTTVDYPTGTLAPERPANRRHLSDMPDHYLDRGAVGEMLARGEDPEIYHSYEAPVPHEEGHLVFLTTVIHPGRIGDEYYMTKGHHHVRDTAEVYLGLAGHGWMAMQTRDGQFVRQELGAGIAVYVPPGWAHRTINDGDEDLVFFASYFGDAGHDYASIEKDGFAHRMRTGTVGAPERPG